MKFFALLSYLLVFTPLLLAAESYRVENNKLVNTTIDYKTGKQLIMVTHPNCGFSRRAFKEMPSEVKKFLKTNGILLAPGSKKYIDDDVKTIHMWNLSNQPFEHFIVFDERKFLPFDLTFTPQFYFYHDGKLVSHVKGWPKVKSNAIPLKMALKKLQSDFKQ